MTLLVLPIGLLGRGPAGSPGPTQRGAGPEFAPDIIATEVGHDVATAILTTSKETRRA